MLRMLNRMLGLLAVARWYPRTDRPKYRRVVGLVALSLVPAFGQATSPSETASQIASHLESHFGVKNARVVPIPISVDEEGSPEFSYHRIHLGRLDRGAFERVRAALQFPLPIAGRTWMPSYDPSREYNLMDFLPPKIAPVLGHYFYGLIEAPWAAGLRQGLDPNIEVDANCWSTALDVLRSGEEPTSFHGFWEPQPTWLKDPRWSTGVANPSLENLRAFDYLIEYDNRNRVQHVAIYIGAGLVFEKTAPSEIGLYRIVPLALKPGTEFRRPVATPPSHQNLIPAERRFPRSQVMSLNPPAEHATLIDHLFFEVFDASTSVLKTSRPLQLKVTPSGSLDVDSKDPLSRFLKKPRLPKSLQGQLRCHGLFD